MARRNLEKSIYFRILAKGGFVLVFLTGMLAPAMSQQKVGSSGLATPGALSAVDYLLIVIGCALVSLAAVAAIIYRHSHLKELTGWAKMALTSALFSFAVFAGQSLGNMSAIITAAAFVVVIAGLSAFGRASPGWRPPQMATIMLTSMAGLVVAVIAVFPSLGSNFLIAGAIIVLAMLALCGVQVMTALESKKQKNVEVATFVLVFVLFVATVIFSGHEVFRFAMPLAFFVFALAVGAPILKRSIAVPEVDDDSPDVSTILDKAISNFIPKEFLSQLGKTNFAELKLGDHALKEMTVFFSDIRGFTEMSEALTPTENFAFINSYLSRVAPMIQEHGGFVDKYMGDGIMALFADAKGPDEAVRSAIATQAQIQEYNRHRASCGYPPIAVGIGIHTGELMLGVVGVAARMEGTVISDAVNLASRLQAITKAFNISLSISEETFLKLEDPGQYKYRFIGKVKVKGKSNAVSVFEIFNGIAPDIFDRKMAANRWFEQGMLLYYSKNYLAAIDYFRRVLEILPEDGASRFYLENCITKSSKSLKVEKIYEGAGVEKPV